MASLNLNKVILVGRLTADPELKTTQSGISVTTFTVAVNRRFSKDEQKQADFLNIVAWRQQAEFVTRYFRKGSSICIIGSLQSRSWTDQNNQKRYATEVVADEVNFVDSKSDGAPAQGGTSAFAPADQYAAPAYSSTSDDNAKFEELSNDDDLPF